jgi:predicted ABC-type ATPase
MKPPKGHDRAEPPVMAVIAGWHGAGKTTLLEQLLGEDGFPAELVVDHPDNTEVLHSAMTRALALNQSIAVETSFEHAGVVQWMARAADRGFSVELIIIGVDDDELLFERHARQQEKRKLIEAVRRMSSAVDNAQRVAVIDNSTGTPFVAATIDAGEVKILDSRPAWVARRILAPRLARLASLKAIRGMYQTIAGKAAIAPVLQVGWAGAAVTTGKVVALSDYHLLLQLSETLHVIHDVSLLSTGGAGLVINAVATVMYSRQVDYAVPEGGIEQQRDQSQER